MLLAGAPVRAESTATPGAPDGAASSPSPDYFWNRAEPGPFVAGSLEAGIVVRSAVAVGYGRPHWQWAGLQGEVFSTPSFAQEAVSAIAALPFATIALSATQTAAYYHHLPALGDRVTRQAVESGRGPVARYRTLGAWGSLLLPVGGWITWISASADRMHGVPSDRLVFDEVRTTVVRAPWVTSLFIAELRCLGEPCHHRLGLVAEGIQSSRDDGAVGRLGVGYSGTLGSHTTALAYASWPLLTPDELGWLGLGGTAALSYAWSTREPSP